MTCPTRSRFELLIEVARSGAASTTFTERNSLNIHAPSEAATSTENPNLSAALDLAVAGMPIFPTRPDKRPLLVGWQEKATTGPQQMHNWWHAHPARLPAIDVGRAGLVVIDCDRHPGGNDGIKAFNQLASGKGIKLANVPMTKTPRGGAHLFFKQPNGEPLGNGRGELPDGIDVRGLGGFVIGPGASLPDGRRWEPVGGKPLLSDAFKAGTIPELPQCLAAIIRPDRQPNGGGVDGPAHNFADISGVE
jgi:hypothetical protein